MLGGSTTGGGGSVRTHCQAGSPRLPPLQADAATRGLRVDMARVAATRGLQLDVARVAATHSTSSSVGCPPRRQRRTSNCDPNEQTPTTAAAQADDPRLYAGTVADSHQKLGGSLTLRPRRSVVHDAGDNDPMRRPSSRLRLRVLTANTPPSGTAPRFQSIDTRWLQMAHELMPSAHTNPDLLTSRRAATGGRS